MDNLSHVDKRGKAVMVDVSSKIEQRRTALAVGHISLQKHTIELIRENNIKKGDVLTVAEIAGIQAAKKTPVLIPLCHPLQIGKIDVNATLDNKGVSIEAKVISIGRTGVEMEALTAVSIALLTIYDMCKAVDKEMKIDETKLVEKRKEDL